MSIMSSKKDSRGQGQQEGGSPPPRRTNRVPITYGPGGGDDGGGGGGEKKDWRINPSPDLFKDLDQVVAERGITKPGGKWRSGVGGGGGIGIGGGGGGAAKSKLDPRMSSLDDIVIERGFGGGGGGADGGGGGGHGKKGMNKRIMSYRDYKEYRDRDKDSEVGELSPREEIISPSPPKVDVDVDHPTKRVKRVAAAPVVKPPQPALKKMMPFEVLSELAGKGTLGVEVKVGQLKDQLTGDLKHLWRYQVKSGNISVRVDSQRKEVAREVAGSEFLKILEEDFPSIPVPQYELPQQIFICPKIFDEIDMLAKAGKLKNNNNGFSLKSKKCVDGKFRAMYSDNDHGRRQFTGQHMNETFAKVEAAQKLYEFLAKEKFAETPFFLVEPDSPDDPYDFEEEDVLEQISEGEIL